MHVRILSRRRASVLLAYLVILVLVFKCILITRQSSQPNSIGVQRAHNAATSLPPIDKLITKNGSIIGDVSFLLDFAIIAFPKSGTTFMKDYLNSSPELWLYETEFCMKKPDDLQRFIRLYHEMHVKLKQSAHNKSIKFGLKCPGVLYRNDIQFYRQYFPNTKLIVGLRHPVSWFESFYNYQCWRNVTMPSTLELVGACTLHGKVCTDRARFHSALARMGLTEMDSHEEIALLVGSRYANKTNEVSRVASQKHSIKLSNPVFIYEVRQIHDTISSKQLSRDIQQYIQVEDRLPEIVSYSQNKKRTIHICNEEHDMVRKLLVEHGRDAADWIQKYFVHSPNIFVSAPESFLNLLNDWRSDPCR